jgi:hypothetical protein
MAGIEHDRIEPYGSGALCRAPVPSAKGRDVSKVHGARLDGVAQPGNRAVSGANGHFPTIEIAGVLAVMHQFETRQAAVPMHCLDHAAEIKFIALVPKIGLGERLGIAGDVEVALALVSRMAIMALGNIRPMPLQCGTW